MMDVEEIKNRIRSAVEITKGFEDPYRIEAFKIVLTRLLESPSESPAKRSTSDRVPASKYAGGKQPGQKTTFRGDIVQNFMKIDDDRLAKMSHLKGRNRYLLLLKVAKDKGVDGLSSAEIEYILKQRFMLKGIHETNIRRDLRKSTGLVEKAVLGKGHAFKITKEGEEYITKELDKVA